ncbi:hypothetical protein DPMN_039720 [Dreissena polymorpha]|uniref:Uncharacterized protein n=1 Tax=Dreissena polymorpha TaxID=45954 RepID=A0A9D4CVS8_DREPO|nr:hypothetical protein DPMN_039720 [Dreissena polymorpha]
MYCANFSLFGEDTVKSDFRSKELDTHKELCRLSGMCSVTGNPSSCCDKCSCEPSCNATGNDECCPDFIKIDSFNDGSNMMNFTDQRCIPLKLAKMNGYIEPGVFGYANCQNGPLHLKKRCELEYKSNEATLSDMLICVSNKTNTYYRNKHCALCHGEMENDLKYLTAAMNCYHPPFSEEIDIKRSVLETRNCTIVFKHEGDIPQDFNEKSCWTTIDRCNITGEWDKYDPELEDACHKDHSFIRFPYDNLRFQNVFCFLCNRLKASSYQRGCFHDIVIFPSFSGLLKIDTRTSTLASGNTILQSEVCE